MLRIRVGHGGSSSVEVLNEHDEDITEALKIHELGIFLAPGEEPAVTLHCHAEIELDVLPQNIRVVVDDMEERTVEYRALKN